MFDASVVMFFVLSGRLTYVKQYEEEEAEVVMQGMWACEPVLWTNWMHVGFLTAATHCRLLCVSAEKFQVTLKSFHPRGFCISRYANEFVNCLNSSDQWDLTDLLDPRFLLDKMVDDCDDYLDTPSARPKTKIRKITDGMKKLQ